MTLDRRAITKGALAAAAAAVLPKAALAAPKTHSVTVDAAASKFTPAALTIKAGDTVEWENTAYVAHSATFDPAKSKVAGNVALPAGVAPFDSGMMKGGAKFSHTFTVKGTYKYICRFHENMGMVGQIIVR